MDFATNLTNLLKENNLNYEKLAAVTGFTARAISYWAQGKRIPSVLNAKKIADYFGVSVDSMLKVTQEG